MFSLLGRRSACVAALFVLLSSLAPSSAGAVDYFVKKGGDDAKSGTALGEEFATVQRGVNALKPGDTLTIAPGEYFESVERADLGDKDHDTIIRAQINGTVTLRGDIPAPKFMHVPGTKFTYAADFDYQGQVPVVNEIDTLATLNRMPNAAELDFVPGTFYHDVAAKKLYVASSDRTPVEDHRYSVDVLPKDGLYLASANRVTIEGLAFTGYSSMEVVHYRRGTGGGVWGLFLYYPKSCTVRDCKAYLNGWGIGINSEAPGSGDNVIERCEAWGNSSMFANSDMGGITIFRGRRDVIRDSNAYLNGMYGINIYGTGGAPPGVDDGGNVAEKKSRLTGNIAWGNTLADFKIKTGYDYFHTVENSIAAGNCHSTNIVATIAGNNNNVVNGGKDSVFIDDEKDFDPNREFADPINHDYRLQSTSRFRKTGPNGADRGAHPYQASVFYVKPDGDDAADGLSLATAWKTLAHAVSNRKAGDTLYLEPGRYVGGVEVRSAITIRGRGLGPVFIDGGLEFNVGTGITLERLQIDGTVESSCCSDINFLNCVFTAKDVAVRLAGATRVHVSHCTFTGSSDAALELKACISVSLSGNIFDNAGGSALKIAGGETVKYANYNSYRNGDKAWEVKGASVSWTELRKRHEQESQVLAPEFAVTDAGIKLKNPGLFAAGGPFGKPLGPYRDVAYRAELRLVEKPNVHSVSATTANIEWVGSLPATCEIAWGETPACENKATYDADRFATYSFVGLKPATKYYFKITKLSIPTALATKFTHTPVDAAENMLEFTTAATDAAPQTYYVATDGADTNAGTTRDKAFRTIRHAASKVNVGDTVIVGEGTYAERVRVRATGAPNKPITFRCATGEKVWLDGASQALNSAFVSAHKSHLRFDGFYLAGYNFFPESRFPLWKSAEFQLFEGKDIEISRCFSDGRGGYSAESVSAQFIEDFRLTNCVNTNKMGGALYIWRCPDFVARNNVFAAPMINSFVLRNTKTQKSTMDDNIFTDMFDKKARLNLGLLCCDGDLDSFQQHNNCYLLRDVIPLKERNMVCSITLDALGAHLINPLFADPAFAGDPNPSQGNLVMPNGVRVISPDRMMDAKVPLDFHSFFATNPEVVKRGMGLQPEAFRDFKFRPESPLK
jgi:hypothetical protein